VIRWLHQWLLPALLLLSLGQAAADTPPAGWKRQYIPVPLSTSPPKIDGQLDDECWKNAIHTPAFHRLLSQAPIQQPTYAWICADERSLYIAFRCVDSQAALIRANETQRDGNLSQDDYVALDIDSQNTRRNLSVFQVNARGTQWSAIDGGTAKNITWAGDWRAMTQRTKDGWTAEIAIPFRLLRYPHGARSLSMILYRKIARETSATCWPPFPNVPEQDEAKYLNEFTGLLLPDAARRPVFLWRSTSTVGQRANLHLGGDAKLPVSNGLTGVATLFPDFENIEQDVASIRFSYNEQFIADHRPFFAEGADFLPSPDLFYSPRLRDVDAGIKVAGKEGQTTFGLLGTFSSHDHRQRSAVLNVARDIGLFSSIGVQAVSGSQVPDAAGDRVPNRTTSEVWRLNGRHGWRDGTNSYAIVAHRTESRRSGAPGDSADLISFSKSVPYGRPYFDIGYSRVGPDFSNDLAFVPETNLQGGYANLRLDNHKDKGYLETYSVGLLADYYAQDTRGFFHKQQTLNTSVGFRSGWGVGVASSRSERYAFRDFVRSLQVNWGEKTLFQRGSIALDTGNVSGAPYRYLSLSQGSLLSRLISVNAMYSTSRTGSERTSQTIVSSTWRMDGSRALGGRLVQSGRNANVYLAFSQRERSGNELSLLLGKPNSPRSRGELTGKLVRPF
jgi:hypothetical protein